MNIDKSSPTIFVSYSQKQKIFSLAILHELETAHYHTSSSYDNDMLSYDAIEILRCNLAVLVVSEDYITSLRGMFDLQNLLSAKKPIYPIFYGLLPVDLVNDRYRQKWGNKWNEFNKEATALAFHVYDWKNCLATLDLFYKEYGSEEIDHAVVDGDRYLLIKQRVLPEILRRCHSPASSLTFPSIFLSYSSDQKLFTEALWQRLTQANYSCFFNEDTHSSLRREILQSISVCELAVVVVSKQYVNSFQSILELQHISKFHKVFLVFIGTKKEDFISFVYENDDFLRLHYDNFLESRLSNAQGATFPDDTIHSEFVNETVIPKICQICPPYTFMNEGEEWVKEILINFNNIIVDEDTVMTEIQDEMGISTSRGGHGDQDAKMQKGAVVLGIHGVEGSGKTTMCKFIVFHQIRSSFPGLCGYLELPSLNDETLLLNELKCLTKKLGIANNAVFDDVNQTVEVITDNLKGKNIFLTIDNVCEWSMEYVQKIILNIMNENHEECITKNIIVTSRSEHLLQLMLQNLNLKGARYKGMHVPRMIQTQFGERRFFSGNKDYKGVPAESAPRIFVGVEKDLQDSLVDGQIRDHFHAPDVQDSFVPKSTLEKGDGVEKDCQHSIVTSERNTPKTCHGVQKDLPKTDEYPAIKGIIERTLEKCDGAEKDCQHSNVTSERNTPITYRGVQKDLPKTDKYPAKKDIIGRTLKRYCQLEKDLQKVLVDVATFSVGTVLHVGPRFWRRISMFYEKCTVDKLISHCIRLQYLGFWELHWTGIGYTNTINTIHMHHIDGFIDAIASSRCLIYRGSNIRLVKPKYAQNVAKILVLSRRHENADTKQFDEFKELFKQCGVDNVEILVILDNASMVLDAKDSVSIMSWSKLRVLELTGLEGIKRITGLEGAPNLVYLVLRDCPDLRELHPLSHLQGLKELEIGGAEMLKLPDLRNLKHLQRLSLRACPKLCQLTELQCMSSVLEDLELMDCDNLEDLRCIGAFPSLQRIFISGSSRIQQFPRVKLDKLKYLNLIECPNLEEFMPGATFLYEELPNLEGLDLNSSKTNTVPKRAFLGLQKMARLNYLDLGLFDYQYFHDTLLPHLNAVVPDLVSLEHENLKIRLCGNFRGTPKISSNIFNNITLLSPRSMQSMKDTAGKEGMQILFIDDGEDSIITSFISEMVPHDKVNLIFINEESHEVHKNIQEIINKVTMQVIVISKIFVKKKWAMIQLEHLFYEINRLKESNQDPCLLTIFFGIEPKDLVDAYKLKKWKEMWKSMDTSNHLSINTDKWPEALEMLKSTHNPQVVPIDLLSPLKYIDLRRWTKEVIVIQHILTKMDSVNDRDINPINKYKILVEEIANKFAMIADGTKALEEKETSPFIIGFYSTNACGKTKISEIIEQYYQHGRFCLNLPHEEDEDSIITQVKEILMNLELANDDVIGQILDVNQAILVFSQRVKAYHGLIIIDNVCDWSKYHVLCMLSGQLGGCKIIVTSHSQRMLKWLFCHMKKEFVQVEPIPTIDDTTNKEEM